MQLVEIVPESVGVGPHAVGVGVLKKLGHEVAPRRDLGLGKVPVVQQLPSEDCGRLLELKENDAGGSLVGIEQTYRAECLASRGGYGYPSVDVEDGDGVRHVLRKRTLRPRGAGVASPLFNAAGRDYASARILDDHGHTGVLFQNLCDPWRPMSIAGGSDELAEQRRDFLDRRQAKEPLPATPEPPTRSFSRSVR